MIQMIDEKTPAFRPIARRFHYSDADLRFAVGSEVAAVETIDGIREFQIVGFLSIDLKMNHMDGIADRLHPYSIMSVTVSVLLAA